MEDSKVFDLVGDLKEKLTLIHNANSQQGAPVTREDLQSAIEQLGDRWMRPWLLTRQGKLDLSSPDAEAMIIETLGDHRITIDRAENGYVATFISSGTDVVAPFVAGGYYPNKALAVAGVYIKAWKLNFPGEE
jgi:hypothetical protein